MNSAREILAAHHAASKVYSPQIKASAKNRRAQTDDFFERLAEIDSKYVELDRLEQLFKRHHDRFERLTNRAPTEGLIKKAELEKEKLDDLFARNVSLQNDLSFLQSKLRLDSDDFYRRVSELSEIGLFRRLAHNDHRFKGSIDEALWKKISRKSGLPDEARPVLDAIMTFFRARQEVLYTTPDGSTSAHKKAIAKARDCLTEMLERPFSLRDVVNTGRCTAITDEQISNTHLFKKVSAARNTLQILGERLPNVDPRPRKFPDRPTELIEILNELLFAYTGRRIHRNDGDNFWIDEVCMKVDERYGPGQISGAIQDVVTAINRRSKKHADLPLIYFRNLIEIAVISQGFESDL